MSLVKKILKIFVSVAMTGQVSFADVADSKQGTRANAVSPQDENRPRNPRQEPPQRPSPLPPEPRNPRRERPPERPTPPPERPTPPPPRPPERPPVGNVDEARAAGEADGRIAGQNDGLRQGEREGQSAGESEGYRDGFSRCEREAQRREYDQGYQTGYSDGENRGISEGRNQGDRDGQIKGQNEGDADGTRRADGDAQSAAYGPGRDRGYREANSSDAQDVGRREGLSSADRDARSEAERTDYPRGREALRAERFAEPISREDGFSQRAPAARAEKVSMAYKMARLEQGSARTMGRRFGTPEEQAAYDQAYNWAYDREFRESRDRAYRHAYGEAARRSSDRGCREAMGRDYRQDYNRGLDEGRREGYRRAYDDSYQRYYQDAYNRSFASASQNAYNQHYQDFYNRYFESARSAAYNERYRELYQQAYRPAYDEKYRQVYPGFAEQAYQRGRVDEAQDFVNRPLRLESVSPTETISNGVFEPAEALRTRFVVRNFNQGRIDGQQIKINLVSLDSSAATVSQAASLLVKALEGKSRTTVSEALEFFMNESAVNKNNKFRFEIYVNGKLSDSKEFLVGTQFMADLSLVSAPDLKEGLPTMVTVRVKNQSKVSIDSGTVVRLASQLATLEVLDSEKTLSTLAVAEEQQLQFRVIYRGHGEVQNLPLTLEAKSREGRRIGAFSLSQNIPVTNDYRIDVISGVDGLKKEGVTRLEYRIINVGSRSLLNSLQLSFQVLGAQSQNFVVIGPNPQFLSPMIAGQSITFVVPVLVKSSGLSGTAELDVKEDGQSMMIHRREF